MLILLLSVVLNAQTEYKVQPGWKGNELEIEIEKVMDVYGSTVLIIAEKYPEWINVKKDSQPLKVEGSESIPVRFQFDISENVKAGTRGKLVVNVYKGIELFGSKEINFEVELPKVFFFFFNYHNPFNPLTKIKFNVPKKSQVKLVVYNMLGEEVETLIDEKLDPGYYDVNFDASHISSGRYFYRLITKDKVITKKMLLVK